MQVPLFRGAEKPLIQLDSALPSDCKSYYGENGFGDVPLPDKGLGKVQDENAVAALNRLVEQNKGLSIQLSFGKSLIVY